MEERQHLSGPVLCSGLPFSTLSRLRVPDPAGPGLVLSVELQQGPGTGEGNKKQGKQKQKQKLKKKKKKQQRLDRSGQTAKASKANISK
jgi:hypothetical protein